MTVEQTLANLVAIDSVSSRSNSEIISYLAEKCRALSLDVYEFRCIDESGIEKTNLVAVARSPSKAPSQPAHSKFLAHLAVLKLRRANQESHQF